MNKSIDEKLLEIEPSIILEHMDTTEKIMYFDYLTESKSIKENELKNAIPLEQILEKEEITVENLC